MITNFFNRKVVKIYRSIARAKINKHNIAQLKNQNFSIISSNCNGAFLLHDLKQKFRSPTVNLWFEPSDFIEFLSHLEKYLSIEIEFSDELGRKKGYPVGILHRKVKVYFQHYKSCEEARQKWKERCTRVCMDNLFIMFTDRDGCSYEDIAHFDALPYQNKVIFTNKPYPEFKSAFYIPGFENESSVGHCFDYTSTWTGEKVYDIFPYIKWLNGELIHF